MATKAAKQEYKREQLLEMIEQRARAADLDPQVVIRVAELESSLRPISVFFSSSIVSSESPRPTRPQTLKD